MKKFCLILLIPLITSCATMQSFLETSGDPVKVECKSACIEGEDVTTLYVETNTQWKTVLVSALDSVMGFATSVVSLLDFIPTFSLGNDEG